jgi:hypothetical protein
MEPDPTVSSPAATADTAALALAALATYHDAAWRWRWGRWWWWWWGDRPTW